MRVKKNNPRRLNLIRLQILEFSAIECQGTLNAICKETEDKMKRRKQQEIVEN